MPKNNTKFDLGNLIAALFSFFFFAEAFLQKYNENSWTYLLGLLVAMSAVLFLKKDLILPSKNLLAFLAFCLIITAAQSLLNGSHLLEGRWINRYAILLLTLIFLQYFTEDEALNSIAWPFLCFIFVLAGWSLVQYLFEYQTDSKYALSTFGSRFWNISYYAQAMSLSLPLLSFFKLKKKSKPFTILSEITIVAVLITLFASQNRTSWISLILFVSFELFRPQGLNRKKLISFLAVAFLINSLVWQTKTAQGEPKNVQKVESYSFRKNVYEGALKMAKDFPTGLGPDKFGFSLNLYYDTNKKFVSNFWEVNISPHNEFLQVLTEDGWAIFTVFIGSILFLLYYSIKELIFTPVNSLFPRVFIGLLPQMLLHFPFDLYMPVLIFSLTLPTFLKKYCFTSVFSRKLKITLFATSCVVFSLHWIRKDSVLPNSMATSYCEIFQDNFDVCKKYFLEAYQAGDLSKASNIIRPILKYQPFNHFALALDYTLGVEPKSQIAACLYNQLFNGDYKIPESPTEKCTLTSDIQKKNEMFTEYSEKR